MNNAVKTAAQIGGLILLWQVGKGLFDTTVDEVTKRIKLIDWDLRNINIGLSGLSGQGVIILKNDLPITIPDNSFKGQLILGDTPIAPALLSSTDLVAGENREFVFDVNVSFLDLGTDIINLIQNPSQLRSGLRLKGNLTSNGNIIIPIDQRLI